jgi:hypothetical protein
MHVLLNIPGILKKMNSKNSTGMGVNLLDHQIYFS